MWDPRIVMGMIHEYGRAVAEQRHERAGALYAQLARALGEDLGDAEERPGRSEDQPGRAR